MASLITEDATLEDLNKAIEYVNETLRTCRTDRREKFLELIDSLLDAKLELIPATHAHR